MPGAQSLAQSSLHYALVRKSPRCALFALRTSTAARPLNCSPPTHEGVPLPQLFVSYHEPRTTLYQFCPNAVSPEAYFIFRQRSGPPRAAFIKPLWPHCEPSRFACSAGPQAHERACLVCQKSSLQCPDKGKGGSCKTARSEGRSSSVAPR